MRHRKLYLYNPETDNFERFYPTIKDRAKSIFAILIFGLLAAVGFYFLMFYLFETPTVENLTAENKQLRQQYSLLEDRIQSSLNVMQQIQHRDSNLYRVLLQMGPQNRLTTPQSVISLSAPGDISNINDATLVASLLSRIDTLDMQLLQQVLSFNKIRDVALYNQDKLDHIPSVLPINVKDYTMSSGYGMRRDPVYKSRKFHPGLDLAAETGTQVFATADGVVSFAREDDVYGFCVDIEHGYNYKTRYAHLSEILVEEGKSVKRGELLGLVGSSGKSTGPHLHYEVHFKDEPQNPINYYFMDLTPEEYEEMIEMAENAGHVMD